MKRITKVSETRVESMARGGESFHHHFILLKARCRLDRLLANGLMLHVQLYRLWGKVGRLPKLLPRQHGTVCLILSHDVFSAGVYEE
jgi:hypothetical protein